MFSLICANFVIDVLRLEEKSATGSCCLIYLLLFRILLNIIQFVTIIQKPIRLFDLWFIQSIIPRFFNFSEILLAGIISLQNVIILVLLFQSLILRSLAAWILSEACA